MKNLEHPLYLIEGLKTFGLPISYRDECTKYIIEARKEYPILVYIGEKNIKCIL